ncbi:MAG: glycosyltransferase family 2 protein [Oscillospiraceae bacterium]|nr:glycosyltransferase family 2 protein [Oscillospiraceae bacterium]
MKISFVIPCYCSENTIEAVVEEIRKTIESTSYEYEIVLVNDCSPDGTFQTIEEICNRNKNVIGISFAKNFGQHAALMAGLRAVSGDIVICLDDDGQTPADECIKLIDKIEEGYDVVYASYESKKHSGFRNLGSNINKLMLEFLLEKPKELFVSSYFAARRYVIDEVIKYDQPFPYLIGLVLRSTNNIANVSVNHRDRMQGVSGYTMKRLISLWMNGFTAFSVKPLRIAEMFGVITAVLGFLYAIWNIIKKIVNPIAPIGWSSTISVILIIGGAILCVLGMMGEYIGRIYICINNAPQYVIKNVIDNRKHQ